MESSPFPISPGVSPVRSITSLSLELIWTGTLKNTNWKLLEEEHLIFEISWFPDTTVRGVNTVSHTGSKFRVGAIPSRRGTEYGPWYKEWSPQPPAPHRSGALSFKTLCYFPSSHLLALAHLPWETSSVLQPTTGSLSKPQHLLSLPISRAFTYCGR